MTIAGIFLIGHEEKVITKETDEEDLVDSVLDGLFEESS
jgi:hypothetical protein